MTTLANRISKLEQARGTDDHDRYLNSLTDDELEAEIDRITELLRASLIAEGHAAENMSSDEMAALVKQLEAEKA